MPLQCQFSVLLKRKQKYITWKYNSFEISTWNHCCPIRISSHCSFIVKFKSGSRPTKLQCSETRDFVRKKIIVFLHNIICILPKYPPQPFNYRKQKFSIVRVISDIRDAPRIEVSNNSSYLFTLLHEDICSYIRVPTSKNDKNPFLHFPDHVIQNSVDRAKRKRRFCVIPEP